MDQYLWKESLQSQKFHMGHGALFPFEMKFFPLILNFHQPESFLISTVRWTTLTSFLIFQYPLPVMFLLILEKYRSGTSLFSQTTYLAGKSHHLRLMNFQVMVVCTSLEEIPPLYSEERKPLVVIRIKQKMVS